MTTRENKWTILLVDDEDIVRGVTRRMLETVDYQVLEGSSAFEALDIASSHAGRIDLLVSDVQMPGMNGVELASQLERARPGIRILLISGHAEAAQFNYPLLNKPFSVNQLLDTVDRIMEMKAGPIPARGDQTFP